MWHLWAGYVWDLRKSHWETPETETKSHFLFSARATLTSKQPRLYSNFRQKLQDKPIPPRLFQVTSHQLWGTNLPPQRAHQATRRDAARVALKAATAWACGQQTSVVINAAASLAGLSGLAAVRFITAISSQQRWFDSFVKLIEIADTCAHINACLAHLNVQPNFGKWVQFKQLRRRKIRLLW